MTETNIDIDDMEERIFKRLFNGIDTLVIQTVKSNMKVTIEVIIEDDDNILDLSVFDTSVKHNASSPAVENAVNRKKVNKSLSDINKKFSRVYKERFNDISKKQNELSGAQDRCLAQCNAFPARITPTYCF